MSRFLRAINPASTPCRGDTGDWGGATIRGRRWGRSVGAHPRGGVGRRTVDLIGSAFGDPAGYEAWFTGGIGAFVDELECAALRRVVGDAARGVVVDVGAGTGHFARALVDRFEIIAVDPSAAMCREGRIRGAGLPIRWCVGVGERLPLEESCVDGVLAMTTLEWVDDPQRCVAEARRVLRPDGWLVIGFLSALSPWAALYRRQADEGVEPWRRARFFTRSDIEDLVGTRPDGREGVVHLAPQAVEPWGAAERAGRRAGNQPALEVLRWNLTR